MSKEQLEEIKERALVDKVYYKYLDGRKGHWGKTYTLNEEDYKYLREQAERVQELEKANKQLKNNLSVYKGYYKNTLKINEDVIEENKKYRNLIKDMGREIEVLTDVMSNADNADELNEEMIRLKGELENER